MGIVEPGPAGAPLITVVVPVYGIEEYIRGCLDSVLADPTPELEVVAVDDRSPDSCGAILDQYAAADPRVRVLHLTENVGLGRARNAGLDAASGEYVWFVDGDDAITPGALHAVVARLRELRPDVLLVDHLKAFPDGRTADVDPSVRQLYDASAPPVSSLDDRPDLFSLQHIACNKVVRRAFLERIGVRFVPGWYEDYLFSHPVLMAAERIAVLPRVCYLYRQHDGSGITRTVSARHFEAFEQYDRLFALVDSWGSEYRRFKPQLFSMMISHLLVIAGNRGRVPGDQRRAFFHRIAEQYRRYLPAEGYRRPPGIRGLKHALVRMDAYWLYALLRAAYLLVGRLSGLPARQPKSSSTASRLDGIPLPRVAPRSTGELVEHAARDQPDDVSP
ncbi:MAG TPA: glycosyltransferase family 2 protein [Micromonosporaceae bacterium]